MSLHTPLQRLMLRPSPSALLTSSPLSQPCILTQHTRLFTTSPRSSAGVRKSKSFAPHQTGMKQPSQKSFEVMKKEQMKNIEQMPNDVGLIPGTFIMPTGSRLPSFTSNFSERFALEKYRLWLRVKEIFGYVCFAAAS
jgi:protein MBA1